MSWRRQAVDRSQALGLGATRGRVAAFAPTMAQLWALTVPAVVLIFLLGRQVTFVDLGYHLRAGMWEWQHHHWLDHDIFTSTLSGASWLNQNWLAQLVLYGLWKATGYAGLIVLNAALYTGGFLLLLRVCLRRVGDIRLASAAALIAIAPAILNTLVRPQAFSWFLLAVVVWLLEDVRRHPRRCLGAIPVMALWANLHGAFVVGLGFLAISTGVALWQGRRRLDRPARLLLVATAGSFGAVLLNPWGWRIYPYVLDVGGNPVVRHLIDEWQPPVLTTVPGALFFIPLFVVVALLVFSKARLDAVDLIRLGVTTLLGLMAIRNGLWWSMAAAPALATLLIPLRRQLARTQANDSPKHLHWVAVAAVAGLLVLASPWARATSPLIPSDKRSLVDSATPAAAAAYLRNHALAQNMFNSQAFGSYLEWASPHTPVFIDSRIEVYSPQLWKDYEAVMTTKPGWQRILERYGIGYVVIGRHPQSYLATRLRRSQSWSLVHSDEVAEIFRFDGAH